MTRLIRIFFTLVVSMLFLSENLLAQESTDWKKSEYVESRLIVSHKTVPPEGGEQFYAGWHVRLAEGWKTYWRTPGAAGLPPQIDWEGSINVADAELMYPMPYRFEIFDLFTYGYHNEVVYPIRITPIVEGAPMTLKTNIRFLVCDDLCIPEEASFQLVIPASEFDAPLSLNAGFIDKFLQKVPNKADMGGSSMTVSSVKVLGSGNKRNVVLIASGENLMTGADLIMEDQNGLTFGIPQKRVLSDSKTAEFIVPVYGLKETESLELDTVNVILSDGWGNANEFTLSLQE